MQKDKKTPEHQAVYEQIRELILLGRFAPGQPITIQGLADTLSVGMTPVREAIRRLTSENALQTLGNRRIIIPDLSQDQLQDIYFLRLLVEPELAKRAAKHATKSDVDRLSLIDKDVDLAIENGDVGMYLERNRAFHFGIYALANAPVLMGNVMSLWLQVGPQLRMVSGRYGTANLPDKHEEILDALLAANPEQAGRAMKEDLEQGISLVLNPSQDV